MRATIGLVLCGILSVACGGGSSSEPAYASESSGREEVATPSPVPPMAAEPPARAEGPASMTVRALVDGQEVPARVRILDESGQVKTEADSGAPISMQSGTHRIELQVSDPSAMADTPKQLREVFLQPGENTVVEAAFPWARVQLNVLVGGRSQPGAPVKLLRDGEVVAEMKGSAPPVAITPGKYEADVQLKGTIIRVKGLQFPQSATQTVPVRVQF